MTTRLYTQDAQVLGEAEAHHSLLFAGAFGVFTLLAFLVVWGVSAAFMPDLTGVLVPATFGVGGGTAMLALILGFRRGRQHRSDIVDVWYRRENEETERLKKERLSQTTALFLPQPAPSAPAVSTGVKQPEIEGTFDKLDLLWLFESFEDGHKHTEDALIGLKLPHSGEKLSRDRYNALLDLLVDRTIVIERGGPGNKSGKLTAKTADEMMKKLMTRPAVPPTPPGMSAMATKQA